MRRSRVDFWIEIRDVIAGQSTSDRPVCPHGPGTPLAALVRLADVAGKHMNTAAICPTAQSSGLTKANG